MRRILVDHARQRNSQRKGGQWNRVDLELVQPELQGPNVDLLALDEALTSFESHDSRACEVVKLRYFAGMTVAQVAESLGVSVSTAENDWAYAKSWLKLHLTDNSEG